MKFYSRGLEVSTESDDAIRAIDHYARELLSLGTDAAAVQAAADANLDCAMLQACCASTFLYTQTTGDEQRGVFAESHLVSLIRAGRKAEARAALGEHIARRPETALERRWAELI